MGAMTVNYNKSLYISDLSIASPRQLYHHHHSRAPPSPAQIVRGRRRKLELSLEMHPFEHVIRIIIISMEKKGSGLRAWLARDIIFILTVGWLQIAADECQMAGAIVSSTMVTPLSLSWRWR